MTKFASTSVLASSCTSASSPACSIRCTASSRSIPSTFGTATGADASSCSWTWL
jgi:hypothetical protein